MEKREKKNKGKTKENNKNRKIAENEGKTMRKNTTYENMIAVTNRQLYLQAAEKNRRQNGKENEEVSEDFLPGTRLWNRYLEQTEQVLSLFPKALILREKDLEPEVYRQLAKEVTALCEASGTECILHGFPDEARALSWRKIHLPLRLFRELPSLDFFEKKEPLFILWRRPERQRPLVQTTYLPEIFLKLTVKKDFLEEVFRF